MFLRENYIRDVIQTVRIILVLESCIFTPNNQCIVELGVKGKLHDIRLNVWIKLDHM